MQALIRSQSRANRQSNNMPKCSVKKCKSNTLTSLKKDGVSYFRFPRNEIEREKWRTIIAAERDEKYFKPNNSSVVCSHHFHESNMYCTKTGLKRIKNGSLPRLELDQTTSHENAALSTTSIECSQAGTSNIRIVKAESLAPLHIPDNTIGENENTQLPVNSATNTNNKTPPSATSSESTSLFDTISTHYYKKSLETCKKIIAFKNRQIQNLKKKNKRLIKRNLDLKAILKETNKKRVGDKKTKS